MIPSISSLRGTALLRVFFLGIWAATATAAIPIRSTYLVLDDRVVDRADNVILKVGTVTKSPANPLFGEDRPWEVRFDNVYPNIAYDETTSRYECWYSPFIVDELTAGTPKTQRGAVSYHSTPTREMGLCYSISNDGVQWTKPELGVVEFAGSKRNNLVLRYSHGAGVLKDVHDADPSRRYKTFGGQQIPGQKRRFQVSFSADGVHWAEPLFCPEIGVEGDTHNNAIWAPELGKYVGITRRWLAGERLVMRAESTDFVHWSIATEVLKGDRLNQTYAMPIVAYQNLYLGFVMVLNTQTDRVQCELAWSPDTVLWRRIDPGHPLIPNSNQPGAYDWGCVYMGTGLIANADLLQLYYGASNGPHTNWRDGFLALATLPVDRFAGYEAGDSAGVVVTQPIRVTGDQLIANVDASNGEISVEVLNQDGLALPNYSGNALARISGADARQVVVSWKGNTNLHALQGTDVRFKFHLHRAKLYSFALR